MIILLFFMLCIYTQTKPHDVTGLIIDTDGKQEYYYHTLKTLARSCNFNCTYKNIYQMLESPSIDTRTEALFFFASPRFITQLHHELSQGILHSLREFCQNKHKLIVLMLPNYTCPQKLTAFLDMITLPKNTPARNVAYAYLKYIGHPNAQSGKKCGTSLINASAPSAPPSLPSLAHNMLFLPKHTPAQISHLTHPLALTIYHKEKNSIIALIPATDITFADIAENFHKNPHKISERNHLLSHVQQLLWELHSLQSTQTLSPHKPMLPHCFTQMPPAPRKKFSAAWLEPKDFYLHETAPTTPANLEQTCIDGCSFLTDCNLDLLWFEVNPEWYFSPRALFKKDTEKVMNALKMVGASLSKVSRDTHASKPRIFIGSDITSNFNGQKPHSCVYDLYGTAYPNIPSPFDIDSFWQQELLEPFKTCYTQLKNSIPINGLFLDFEMYHAPQQASSYNDLMDFSECAWHIFIQKYTHVPACTTVAERVQYLRTHKLFSAYFATLTEKAKAIGQLITHTLRDINPRLRIATYAPTLPSSWFYRGIMSGLSSKNNPIITATFNTDYHLHKQWLNAQNIYITHGGAFMMSKLQHQRDFDFAKEVAQQHDFVWYNRPSRQLYQTLEDYPAKDTWWSAEYSPLDNRIIANGIKSTHA